MNSGYGKGFDGGYRLGRKEGAAALERVAELERSNAELVNRVAELELCIDGEVEIAFGIACEAESASAGEAAALERVAELESSNAELVNRVAELERVAELVEHETVDARKEELLCYRYGDWASPFVDRVIIDVLDGLTDIPRRPMARCRPGGGH